MASDTLRFLGQDQSNPVNCTCDILDKDAAIFNYVQYMFDRTNCMFKYTGLPDTIPEPMLEYMLQIYGSVAIIEWNDSIYAMRGSFGGPPDPYYRPSQCVIANPALGMSDTFKVINHLPPFDKTAWESMPKCVRFLNDSQIQGLLPMFARYAVQMAENDVSIRSAQINSRQQTVIIADNGVEYESAIAYMRNLESGQLAAIGKRPFMEGVQVAESSGLRANLITQLLELQQYLKASWYNEIGLNSNFNMKSTYVSSEEINASADIMLPLIDNMFEQRKMAVECINREFNLSLTVEKNSAWEKKQRQADLAVGDPTVLAEPAPISPVDSNGIQIPSTNKTEKNVEFPSIENVEGQSDAIQNEDVPVEDEILDTVEHTTSPVEVNVIVVNGENDIQINGESIESTELDSAKDEDSDSRKENEDGNTEENNS